MVAGVRLADLGDGMGRQLPALLHREAQFLLDPIPNLYFTRDPFAAIGNGASLHRMFSETRARETLFGDFILRHHPDFAGRVPLYYSRQAPFSLEGGDILNLSARVLAVDDSAIIDTGLVRSGEQRCQLEILDGRFREGRSPGSTCSTALWSRTSSSLPGTGPRWW